MSFHKPLAFPEIDNERRHERHEVDLGARVRELGAPGALARVKDISLGGFRLRQADLPSNAEIWITLSGAHPVRARVVWVRSGEVGCEFYAPLSRADLRSLTRRPLA